MTAQRIRSLRRPLPLTMFAMLAATLVVPAHAGETPPPAPQIAATGVAQINLTPRRVVFDRSKRTEAIYVFNQGNTAVTVDVALIDNVMLSSGEIVPLARVAEKGPEAEAIAATVRSARPLIVAAPSRLTLAPGQGKTVRLRTTLPDTADGAEYRTHLTVTTVPPADTGLTAEQAAAVGRGELVLRIQSVFGVSIPLIVRNGTQPASATLDGFAAETTPDGQALALTIGRSGAGSLYGNIEVRAGKDEIVGLVRGIGVYPEIAGRRALVPLMRPLRRGETVTVRYFAEDSRQGEAMASGIFTAN